MSRFFSLSILTALSFIFSGCICPRCCEKKKIAPEQAKKNMERVYKFIKEAQTYYIATVDKDQPRVRPFGTIHIFDGKLYVQTGKKKNVSKQLAVNGKTELCAFHKGEWIRLSGTLVNDERREAKVSMLNEYPSLKNLYHPDDGNTQVFYFKNATATFNSFTKPMETVEF